MTTTNDPITLSLTEAQAQRLAAIIDSEVAANKNRLVSATLSVGEYHDQAPHLANLIQGDELIRATLRRKGIK